MGLRRLSHRYAFRAQKALTEYKDKLPSDVASDIQNRVDALKKALEGQDNDLIKSATTELQEHMQKIGDALAKAGTENPQQQPNASQQSQKPSSENIEDAEVEIIDESEKH